MDPAWRAGTDPSGGSVRPLLARHAGRYAVTGRRGHR